MSRYLAVNDIINRAAVECGLLPSSNPIADTDETFIQMRGLLDSAGQELCNLTEWPILTKQFEILTSVTDSGKYNLPEDFNYFIDQTAWDRNNSVQMGGPLSPQEWTFLEGRDLVSNTIYASYRENEGQIWVMPSPPPEGKRLTFEYISRSWLKEAGQALPTLDVVDNGNNICMLDPLLMIKFLKLKFQQAKGFDASAAALEFDTLLSGRIGKSTGAPILSASRSRGNYPYLTSYGSTPDTNFGA
tara:strand:+ start:1025 stop:1759 length:735 start_codon:yes stop_codon:yes gene_type:complete